MARPLLFFDTNVCFELARGAMGLETFTIFWKHIRGHYRYVVSPLTLIEILVRVARGSDAYFRPNRLALAMMWGPYGGPILPFPARFMRKRLLREDSDDRWPTPRDFGHWIRVVGRAGSKADLSECNVSIPGDSGFLHGLDIDSVDRQSQNGKEDWVRTLEDLRHGKAVIPPSQDVWGRNILVRAAVPPSDREASGKVGEALDAAYRFESAVYRLARNKSYDFAESDSDWIDRQQLFYLCERRVRFLTEDAKLIGRIAGSPQASRVLRVERLLDEIRAARANEGSTA